MHIKISDTLLKKAKIEAADFLASGKDSMEIPGKKGFFLAIKEMPGMLCVKKLKFNEKALMLCHEK